VAGYKPKGPDEDGMTFLPIDRSSAAEKIYTETDPRKTQALGGVRIGHEGVFVLDEQMPRLTAEGVGQACDNVVRGKDAYSGLLYLSRARVEDIGAMVEASQSYEIKVRWERLWVLTPFLSRLSRPDAGRAAILASFAEDLPGIHLLSKFAEQNNPAIKRMFTRLHDPLLAFLLDSLVRFRDDPRRAALVSGIVGTFEQKEAVLRRFFPADTDEAVIEEVLNLLYVRPAQDFGSRLSSAVLRDKLQGWRRD
jgi:hypothetical protein